MINNHARLKIVLFIGLFIALAAFVAYVTLYDFAQASNQLLAFYEVIPLVLLTGLALTTTLIFHKKHN